MDNRFAPGPPQVIRPNLSRPGRGIRFPPYGHPIGVVPLCGGVCLMVDTTVPGDFGQRARRRWRHVCVLTAAAVVAFAAVLSTGAGGEAMARTLSNIGLCTAAVAAAVACLSRAALYRGRRRWGWALIGLGVLAWGL